MDSSSQHNTSQVTNNNNINDEEQFTDKIETESETPRKSTNKRYYSQISSIEDCINKIQSISDSCKDDDDEFDVFAKSIVIQLKKCHSIKPSFLKKKYCVLWNKNVYTN